MSTRAVQIEILLAGIRDASTGQLVNGGTAYFYSAGTTTPKNVWTEKEKTNPFTSYTLSAIGTAQLYGDGVYKINVLDVDGAQVSGFPRDNVKVRHPNYYNRAVSSTTSQTSDDDFLEVDTTAGAVTINLLAVSSWVSPLKIMHISGANAITLDPSGAELIEGAANYAFTSVGTIIEVVPNASGTALRIAGIRSATLDSDGDTGIEVERTADVDEVRIKTAGVDRVVINSTATDVDALSIGGTLQTTTATEVNQLHDQGAVAADFAKLHAVTRTAADINNLVTLDGTENLSGKTFTDGLSVTGGQLEVGNSVSVTDVAIIRTDHVDRDELRLRAGPYDLSGDSAGIRIYSKDHATSPRNIVFDHNTGLSSLELGADGVANFPVGLQIGGVDVGGETAVTHASGYPAISSALFTLTTSVAENAWESVGPTGSGAANIWTALDSVPAGSSWIRVYVKAVANGGPVSSSVTFQAYARKTGTVGAADNYTDIIDIDSFTDSAGGNVSSNSSEATIPLDSSGRFDTYWTSSYTGSNYSHMRLVSYGKN